MISFAMLSDANEIMEFIDREWKKNHILATNKDFFLYEYASNNKLNFVVSKSENKINGILGFLKSSLDENSTVWTTMWKVSKSNGSPTLGIRMLRYLQSQGFDSIMSNGINTATEEIYSYLGFHGESWVTITFQIENLEHTVLQNLAKRSWIFHIPKKY